MPVIKKIEFDVFGFTVEGLSIDNHMNAVYTPGAKLERRGYAVRVTDSEGVVGEWVNPNFDAAQLAQAQAMSKLAIGRDADAREQLYDDWKRIQRKLWGFGFADVDIALWDMAGKRYGVPVSKLLGGFRERLPTYASTFHGDRNGGLSNKEQFAEYAEYCYELGFRAFKIHGWSETDRREEAANVLHVRKVVGDKLDLMLDPACELKSFGDALYVGRACDEANFFWYEDPYRDGGYSRHAHRKLRQLLKTPILMGEHVRGLEAKADMIASEATDYVRVNPTLDMGITGAMKVVHLAESFGLDAEMHGAGPAHRQCMAAMRNTNFYELALCAPKIGNPKAPIYTCGYSDHPWDVGKDGCFPVPTGPGLGVTYDWDYIAKNRIGGQVVT